MTSSKEQSHYLELSEEKLTSLILKLALPAIGENLLYMLVFIVDTLLIGWLRDPEALAAVSLGGLFIMIANSLFAAISISATAVVARRFGERDYPRAQRAAGQSVTIALIAAALMVALIWPLADELLVLMGGTPKVVEWGAIYMRIILSTSFFTFPMIVLNGIMRGSGDTRTPMYLTGVMNIWNAVAAYLLVLGPGAFPSLGVIGAGVATASARLLGGLLAFYVVFTGKSYIHLSPRHILVWDADLVKTIFRLALPATGETIVMRIGSTLFMRIVSALGPVNLAAHQIAVSVESLSFMPGFGMATAATTLMGQALGAGQVELAEKSAHRCLKLASLIMGSIALVFLTFGRHLVTVFGATPEVLDLAGMAVRISAFEQLPLAVQMVLGGSLRGAGDTRSPMVVTMVGTFLFRISTVYLLAIVLGWGLAGVWWGTAIDWTGRAVMMYLMFRRGRWREVKV